MISEKVRPKPFLKWAGGKGQLLQEIQARLPREIVESKRIERYFEPFVGGGALFFYLARNYTIQKAHLYDINPEIVGAYKIVRNDVDELIRRLRIIENEYLVRRLIPARREEYYYTQRKKYNKLVMSKKIDLVSRMALLIFFNRTGYNGLFRVNSRGEFNVPFGRYVNPTICDEENLRAVSKALQIAEIRQCDFEECLKKADAKSLIYFDPPYRPISKTANFISYSRNGMGWADAEQKRLKRVFEMLARGGSKIILSNSDPKNIDSKDNYFDDLYDGYCIERVKATRLINSDASARGMIKEIIIRNYEEDSRFRAKKTAVRNYA